MTNENNVHIAYAEDNTIVRKGVVSLINSMGGITVAIEAENGKDLLQQLEKANKVPDVCLLDINMPGMNGFEALDELMEKWPEIKVLVLTVFDIEVYKIKMILNGARGYLLKNCNPEELKRAIKTVHNTGFYYSDIVNHEFINDIHNKIQKLPSFTESELQVVKYVCKGMSYAEMAEKMHTTEKSIEGFRASIFQKLHIHNRGNLLLFAVQTGLMPIEINKSGRKKDVMNVR